jgi:hypothetical protein
MLKHRVIASDIEHEFLAYHLNSVIFLVTVYAVIVVSRSGKSRWSKKKQLQHCRQLFLSQCCYYWSMKLDATQQKD